MDWEGFLKRAGECRFEISSSYLSAAMKQNRVMMNTPGLVYADEEMMKAIKADDSLEQVANVATLPGIVGKSMAMPDIHHGYGFAIGGVAAFDAHDGIISPGGVGYDINCGVRLLRSDLTYEDIRHRITKLIDTMFDNVPCGVGSEGRIQLSPAQLDEVLRRGPGWAVENGYGWEDDLDVTEDRGCIEGADPALVSPTAKKRGKGQLGSLGAGNHFLEIQRVDEIYDAEAARVFGVTEKNQILLMIHTGSRGCGHQICTDYLEIMRQANRKYNIPLLDRELSCAPAMSPEAQSYFTAMKCAANFAWANRQMIAHWVRESFASVLGRPADKLGLAMIYDVAHNIAKLEEHDFEGRRRQLYVHRKGATRAFGPGRPEVPEKYRSVGQPVLIPGDMGTASYLLVGTDLAMGETFGSSCHGAGRSASRHVSRKRHPANAVIEELKRKGIYLQAKSRRVISEEAPGAYKDVDRVVDVSQRAGIVRRVVRLVPVGVVKG
ncbi:MAG: RtcB family protein [candidate division Zixibacteria bacterium]|nr:RtcB family protein [candidate division Zixibacteria bacterium]